MLFFGPISSVFDVSTYAVMWWVFGVRTVAAQQLFQSGWIIFGHLTETLVMHMCRTPRLPLAYFAWLAAILIGYSVLTTVMKRFYIRRFGWQ